MQQKIQIQILDIQPSILFTRVPKSRVIITLLIENNENENQFLLTIMYDMRSSFIMAQPAGKNFKSIIQGIRQLDNNVKSKKFKIKNFDTEDYRLRVYGVQLDPQLKSNYTQLIIDDFRSQTKEEMETYPYHLFKRMVKIKGIKLDEIIDLKLMTKQEARGNREFFALTYFNNNDNDKGQIRIKIFLDSGAEYLHFVSDRIITFNEKKSFKRPKMIKISVNTFNYGKRFNQTIAVNVVLSEDEYQGNYFMFSEIKQRIFSLLYKEPSQDTNEYSFSFEDEPENFINFRGRSLKVNELVNLNQINKDTVFMSSFEGDFHNLVFGAETTNSFQAKSKAFKLTNENSEGQLFFESQFQIECNLKCRQYTKYIDSVRIGYYYEEKIHSYIFSICNTLNEQHKIICDSIQQIPNSQTRKFNELKKCSIQYDWYDLGKCQTICSYTMKDKGKSNTGKVDSEYSSTTYPVMLIGFKLHDDGYSFSKPNKINIVHKEAIGDSIALSCSEMAFESEARDQEFHCASFSMKYRHENSNSLDLVPHDIKLLGFEQGKLQSKLEIDFRVKTPSLRIFTFGEKQSLKYFGWGGYYTEMNQEKIKNPKVFFNNVAKFIVTLDANSKPTITRDAVPNIIFFYEISNKVQLMQRQQIKSSYMNTDGQEIHYLDYYPTIVQDHQSQSDNVSISGLKIYSSYVVKYKIINIEEKSFKYLLISMYFDEFQSRVRYSHKLKMTKSDKLSAENLSVYSSKEIDLLFVAYFKKDKEDENDKNDKKRVYMTIFRVHSECKIENRILCEMEYDLKEPEFKSPFIFKNLDDNAVIFGFFSHQIKYTFQCQINLDKIPFKATKSQKKLEKPELLQFKQKVSLYGGQEEERKAYVTIFPKFVGLSYSFPYNAKNMYETDLTFELNLDNFLNLKGFIKQITPIKIRRQEVVEMNFKDFSVSPRIIITDEDQDKKKSKYLVKFFKKIDAVILQIIIFEGVFYIQAEQDEKNWSFFRIEFNGVDAKKPILVTRSSLKPFHWRIFKKKTDGSHVLIYATSDTTFYGQKLSLNFNILTINLLSFAIEGFSQKWTTLVKYNMKFSWFKLKFFEIITPITSKESMNVDFLARDGSNSGNEELEYSFGIQVAINFFNDKSQMFTLALIKENEKVSLKCFKDSYTRHYLLQEQHVIDFQLMMKYSTEKKEFNWVSFYLLQGSNQVHTVQYKPQSNEELNPIFRGAMTLLVYDKEGTELGVNGDFSSEFSRIDLLDNLEYEFFQSDEDIAKVKLFFSSASAHYYIYNVILTGENKISFRPQFERQLKALPDSRVEQTLYNASTNQLSIMLKQGLVIKARSIYPQNIKSFKHSVFMNYNLEQKRTDYPMQIMIRKDVDKFYFETNSRNEFIFTIVEHNCPGYFSFLTVFIDKDGSKLRIPASYKSSVKPDYDMVQIERIDLYKGEKPKKERIPLKKLVVVPGISPNTKFFMIITGFICFCLALGLLLIVLLVRKTKSIHEATIKEINNDDFSSSFRQHFSRFSSTQYTIETGQESSGAQLQGSNQQVLSNV